MRWKGIGWIAVLLVLPAGLQAEVLQKVSHQGVRCDEDGVPVPDGEYELTVRLCTVM